MLSNFAVSLIRTWVPVGVGFLLTWLATSLKIVVDPSSQAGLVRVVCGCAVGGLLLGRPAAG